MLVYLRVSHMFSLQRGIFHPRLGHPTPCNWWRPWTWLLLGGLSAEKHLKKRGKCSENLRKSCGELRKWKENHGNTQENVVKNLENVWENSANVGETMGKSKKKQPKSPCSAKWDGSEIPLFLPSVCGKIPHLDKVSKCLAISVARTLSMTMRLDGLRNSISIFIGMSSQDRVFCYGEVIDKQWDFRVYHLICGYFFLIYLGEMI